MKEMLESYLSTDNYLGILCYGAHVQEIIELYNDTLIIPLKDLYQNNYIDYIKDFAYTFNYKIGQVNINTFEDDFKDNISVCYILAKTENKCTSIDILESSCIPKIDIAKIILAVLTGQKPHDFFCVAKMEGKVLYKTIPMQFNKLHRLWIGDEKMLFFKKFEQIAKDNKFALSLFMDAHSESNPIYKIARYFMVLECITKSTEQSRKHIKCFFEKAKYSTIIQHNESYIDVIEFAGIIRSKLFHGATLKYKYFNKLMDEHTYNDITSNPYTIIRIMRDYCEQALNITYSLNQKF